MRVRPWALLGAAALVAALLPALPTGPVAAQAADDARITVTGATRMYPAFDPTITRYAVHPAPDGSVQVDVTDADAVWINGVRDEDGTATFAAPAPGDEISIFLQDVSGRHAYALHVLPPGFPTLSATATGASLQAGSIALTLDRYDGVSPRFEAVVDRQGVPSYTRAHRERVLDLKMAANGRYTLHRPTTTPGRSGGALVVLDDRFQELRRVETTGLVNTDDHDSLLLPDGSHWLVSYEPDPTTGLVDSVIQHVDASGKVVFQWSSAPYADETVTPDNADYAHVNSIDVAPNGDVLASFRHLSSVFLIATRAHDGHQPGDVIWKLGGRDSSFTFPPGDTGPCAQHAATLLPNGNVLLFDNGSTSFFGNLCVDQARPDGPAVPRPSSRVVELTVDDTSAEVVRTYGPADRFSWFMGSAARTGNGNVLIGWSADQRTIASETDSSGATVWTLRDERVGDGAAGTNAYFSYRAALVPARDGFDPQVTLDGPADGASVAVGAVVPVAYSCTDRGGSTLQACDGPSGDRLDTSTTGTRTWSVTARDGAGRTTTLTRSYTVTAGPVPASEVTSAPTPVPTTAAPVPPVAAARALPDLAVRLRRRGSWVGAGDRSPLEQTAVTSLPTGRAAKRTMALRVTNTGTARGRFVMRGPVTVDGVTVTYRAGGESRTRAVTGKGWRTPRLRVGESVRLRVEVATTTRAGRDLVRLPLRASRRGAADRVVVLVRRR
ncbi:arylsulfotransferase family protein [Nocardioides sediminis]|uniref:arylsulfotransferase family protein n=1 Tax=Nocardioides sediminis TaxID=433648 RepID=UPI00131F2EE4|nr:arylsulfotransferase family protein [Nocardioides sediminis]